jgi:hypothetical protein
MSEHVTPDTINADTINPDTINPDTVAPPRRRRPAAGASQGTWANPAARRS